MARYHLEKNNIKPLTLSEPFLHMQRSICNTGQNNISKMIMAKILEELWKSSSRIQDNKQWKRIILTEIWETRIYNKHWTKKWSSLLRISSVNVTKPAVSGGFDYIYWIIP